MTHPDEPPPPPPRPGREAMTTYNEAVAEARRLVKRSEEDQWRLAELTWEQAEAGISRRQWARDTDMSKTHVGALVGVWRRWGGHARDQRPSFYEAYELVKNPSKYEGQEDVSSRHEQTARATVRNMPPERKAEVARELLAEPEVAERVIADPVARATTGRALDQHYDRERELRQREIPTEPPSQYDAAIELLVRLRAISAAIKSATNFVMSSPQFIDTDDLVAVVDWQADALGVLRAVLTGRPNMDAELAKILEEG